MEAVESPFDQLYHRGQSAVLLCWLTGTYRMEKTVLPNILSSHQQMDIWFIKICSYIAPTRFGVIDAIFRDFYTKN